MKQTFNYLNDLKPYGAAENGSISIPEYESSPENVPSINFLSRNKNSDLMRARMGRKKERSKLSDGNESSALTEYHPKVTSEMKLNQLQKEFAALQ